MCELQQTPPEHLSSCSKKGKTVFILGVVSLFFFIIAPFALLLSLVELSRQKKRGGISIRIKRFAQTGLLLSIFSIVIWSPALVYGYERLKQVGCSIHMFYGVWYAFSYYDNEYRALPTPERWCDLLIEHADFFPGGFCCPSSDAVEGESSYALNKHLFDVPNARLPGDIVFLFETDFGKENGPRTASIQSRQFFSFLEKQYGREFESLKDIKVFLHRWNQTGGPEIAVARHQGKCHVVLLNGTIDAVKLSDLHTLRWTID